MVSEVDTRKNSRIKTIVLDVLKPHSPPLPEFANFISKPDGVNKVDINLVEIHGKTESLRITLNGPNIKFDALKELMEKHGAIIHSVDRVMVEK